MNEHGLLSDPLYNWSVRNDRSDFFSPQATAQATASQAAAAGLGPPRLPDRALQALRQSELQVRTGSRPWAQVLPLGELSGPLATDGLRAASRARAGQRMGGQLQAGSRDPGGDLRDQPRTTTAARAALRRNGEPDATVAHRPRRSYRWRNAAGQHARGHDRRRSDVHALRGGRR